MSLKSVYERFLASPSPSNLSKSAALHYVTTLASFNGQEAVIRHLENQNKNVVKKKLQKTISAVEGHSSIALEVETTLEFISSGGAYLPGLDSFIVDRTASIPITHIVHFDGEGKITQIRVNWDQGTLLQQVEVIGTRGRNWPIRDGKDQIKLIASSSDPVTTAPPISSTSRGRTEEQSEVSIRNTSPSKRFIKDPHASLDIFEGPKDDENRRPTTSGSGSVIPRDSARPAPREMSEIFAAGHEDHAPSPNGSPSKLARDNVVAPKGAGARKFQTSRLFEDDQDYKEPKIYKTNPARYNHFDIGDSQDDDPLQYKANTKSTQSDAPLIGRKHKQASQWDFDDVSTPAKAPSRVREQDQVHFSLGNEDNQQNQTDRTDQGAKPRKDAETHFEFLDDGTPVQRRPAQPKARKDAEIHFELRDEQTPPPRRIIARTKAAAGLYSNPLEDDDEQGAERKAPLSNITNNAGRRKDFDSQWDNYDEPSEPVKKPTGAKARQNLTSNWGFDS